jgi:hypothetical protein
MQEDFQTHMTSEDCLAEFAFAIEMSDDESHAGESAA